MGTFGVLPGDVCVIGASRERDPAGFARRVGELSRSGQDVVAAVFGDDPQAALARVIQEQGPTVYREARTAVRGLAEHFSGVVVPLAGAEVLGVALRADQSVVQRCLSGLMHQQRQGLELVLAGASRGDLERELAINPAGLNATLRRHVAALLRALHSELEHVVPDRTGPRPNCSP